MMINLRSKAIGWVTWFWTYSNLIQSFSFGVSNISHGAHTVIQYSEGNIRQTKIAAEHILQFSHWFQHLWMGPLVESSASLMLQNKSPHF